MHLLILGYSNIVQKKVLPALQKTGAITCIDIASRGFAATALPAFSRAGTCYQAYDEALEKSPADLVYISLVNSCHAQWAEAALRAARHVIVDKPACTSLADAARLVELARAENRCLAEATVYACHPQIQMARDLFSEAGTAPTRLTVSFSFPPLPAGNFRYAPDLGGGALYDLGPYAVSPGRLFFDAEPEEVCGRVCARNPDTCVDTAFSMLARYPGGRSMTGHFDFNTEYRNCINILGPGMSVDIDRVFTTPPDLPGELRVRAGNRAQCVAAPATDSFEVFFSSVTAAIEANDFGRFSDQLLSDARVLHCLRTSAAEAEHR